MCPILPPLVFSFFPWILTSKESKASLGVASFPFNLGSAQLGPAIFFHSVESSSIEVHSVGPTVLLSIRLGSSQLPSVFSTGPRVQPVAAQSGQPITLRCMAANK